LRPDEMRWPLNQSKLRHRVGSHSHA